MLEANKSDRRSFLGAIAAVVATSIPAGLFGASKLNLPDEGNIPSLLGASAWLNSRALQSSDLRGKVTLVDFWTYSCINWRRTLPYLRAWSDRYRQHGLSLIGVHTPEFDFERQVENVHQAVKEMKIDYPVAIDNEYAIWQAFGNQYWPALYLVDARGRIRHHQFGEGEYERSERIIQQLLSEADGDPFDTNASRVEPAGFELQADWSNVQSAENYLGLDKTENFSSPERPVEGTRRNYKVPDKLLLNNWALDGECTFGKQAVQLDSPKTRIVYRFHARDLHLVMRTSNPGRDIRFRVQLDGDVPESSHGVDVDAMGNGVVHEPRMYQLVRQTTRIVDRTFEIEFLEPGVQAYSFTFG